MAKLTLAAKPCSLNLVLTQNAIDAVVGTAFIAGGAEFRYVASTEDARNAGYTGRIVLVTDGFLFRP